MKAADFYIKQHDSAPPLQAILTDGDGTPVDLSGAASVSFNMAAHARMEQGTGPSPLVSPAVIVDAANGVVKYEWTAANTGEYGRFYAEFEVVWNNGRRTTFPNDGHIDILISQEVGQS